MDKRVIVFIYEHEQVDDVAAYVKSNDDCAVIALDFWAQRALAEHGVESTPLSTYCPPYEDTESLLRQAQDIARKWYRLPATGFFKHRDIHIGEALEPAVDVYLELALYYLHVFGRILKARPHIEKITVPHSKRRVPPTAGPFMKFEGDIVVDTLRFFAVQKGIQIEMMGEILTTTAIPFPPQSRLRTPLLKIYNTVITALAPRKPIKIFASEYWWHVSPFVGQMDDVELVMMDRSESRTVPWGRLWKHRMRFMHPLDQADAPIRSIARERQAYFRSEWASAKDALTTMPEFQHEGIWWWPLVKKGFDFLVETYAERVVSDAEAIRKILEREKINRVVLRASMSLHQHHFFVAAKVAAQLGVPSIELQHAGAMMDSHSPSARLEASYLAAYGSLTQKFLEESQSVARERVRAVGSPRFDSYLNVMNISNDKRESRLIALGLDAARPVILVTVPAEVVSLMQGHFNSYEIESFFRSLRELKDALPQVQYIFKFRAHYGTAIRRAFIHEVFPNDIAIAEYEDIFSLFVLCDIVFAPNSTVLYEAMIGKKPVVLFPWKKNDPHLAIYAAGGIPTSSDSELQKTVARLIADPAYYKETVKRGDTFLHDNYSFDGHAAERTAAFLRESLKVF